MKITIHRGNQIGGCITEIQTDQSRICIDFGAELPSAERDSKAKDDFEIDGVTTGERNCDAVFITHYHGDHIGLYSKVHSGIPIHTGKAAKDIFLKFSERVKHVPDFQITDADIARIENFETFEERDKIKYGDITITPFSVDHSAFDAYMFLIESGGKRILHTGDFRTHGFKGKEGKTLTKLLSAYVKTVDALIIEGTTLSRPTDEKVETERELQQRTKAIIADNKFVFVLCASTNIDRIAAFYHNAMKCGRTFVCDDYQKGILQIVRQYGGDKTELYNFQDDAIKTTVEDFKTGFCVLVRGYNSRFTSVMNKFRKDGVFIFSMWDGYRNEKQFSELAKFIKDYDFKTFHTSGHATAEAIKLVCDVVKPKKIIPIHGENVAENMRKLGMPYEVLALQDGEEIEI